eukprot:1149109-Prorocentrum_minimum.AAC.1
MREEEAAERTKNPARDANPSSACPSRELPRSLPIYLQSETLTRASLLSFGNEAEEDEAELQQMGGDLRIKSSHDTIDDRRFLKEGTKEAEEVLAQEEALWEKKREKLK